MSNNIQVAFQKVDEGSTALVIPPSVDTPANAGLATVAATPAKAVEARRTLSCKALLVGDTLAQATDEAERLYAEMLDNTQVFMTYGTQALEGVNTLVDRLLKEVEPTNIPELKELMRELNGDMRGLKQKYDVSNPKVRERYEKWKGGILRFIGQAKTMVEMLMEDVRSIEGQIDKVGRTLRDRQHQLTRNVSYYDALYDENEAEVLKLIYVIAVMELIRDYAARDAAAVQVGDANLGDREGERKAMLAEFSKNMELKLTEYKGRLFIAWATSPQVRTMRTLNVALAERINELVCVTIPTMKATILQWRMLMQTKEAAELAQIVAEANNDMLTAYAAATGEVVPMVAEMVETPTLQPATVAAMADAFAKAAQGIIDAADAGAERRKELDEAILSAHQVMQDATQKVSDKLIADTVQRALKPIEVKTSVEA
jgi:uncharacterized protein YaaN involved in tellurite resistance